MKPKRMILVHIPNKKCNLKCKYCYLTQINEWIAPPEKFKYSIEHIAKCLSKERLGGICLINLTGDGETMLQPQIVDLCKLLLEEGHYIEFVTNLTVSKVVKQFLDIPQNLQKHLEFKISYHYKELNEKKLTDSFWENVRKIKESCYSFTLELMPNDDIIDDIPKILEKCEQEVGAPCHLTVGRSDTMKNRGLLTNLTEREYKKTWSVFDSDMFNLKMRLLEEKRKEFCYAGDWTLYVNLYTGETSPCYSQPIIQNIFENPDEDIIFQAVGHHCREPYCINGHAHISLGVIPEFDSPTYYKVRNRKCKNGGQWFSQECEDFFDSKLYESNSLYSNKQKLMSSISWNIFFIKYALSNPKKIIKKIRKVLH